MTSDKLYSKSSHLLTRTNRVSAQPDGPRTRALQPGNFQSMLNFILYATTALIWGSTWLGIKLQLTQVPPILSVGYRFCLASLLIFLYCMLTRKNLRFSRRDHLFMAAQGVSLFGLGYIMSYLATSYLTSGLVAVLFSTILMWNILNLRLFMGQPIAWRAFSGGTLGLGGICIVFWHDLSAFTATRGIVGLIMAPRRYAHGAQGSQHGGDPVSRGGCRACADLHRGRSAGRCLGACDQERRQSTVEQPSVSPFQSDTGARQLLIWVPGRRARPVARGEAGHGSAPTESETRYPVSP